MKSTAYVKSSLSESDLEDLFQAPREATAHDVRSLIDEVRELRSLNIEQGKHLAQLIQEKERSGSS